MTLQRAGGQAFRCDVRPLREMVVVAPVGELDLATAPEVEGELEALREARFEHLVVDLAGVTFMGSSGLALLVRWTQRAAADGTRFSLIGGPRNVQRAIELTGLLDELHFVSHDSVGGISTPCARTGQGATTTALS